MTDNNDDEFYDDALDESFDLDEEDYDEVDLDADLDDFDDPFGEESDVQEEEDNQFSEEFAPINEKKSLITFDRIIILGAVIIGVFVMLSQIKSKAPNNEQASQNTTQQFETALKMEGAFEGPGAIEEENIIPPTHNTDKATTEPDTQTGFLFGDSNQENSLKAVIEDTPPMPNPIAADVTEQMAEQVVIAEKDNSLDSPMNQETQMTDVGDRGDMPRPPETQEIEEVIVIEDAQFEETPEAPIVILEENIEEISIADVEMDSQKLLAPSAEEVIVVPAPVTIDKSLNAKLDRIINRIDAVETKINNFQESNDNNILAMKRDIESLRVGAADVKAQTVTELPIASLSPAPTIEKVAPPKKVSKPKAQKKKVKKANSKVQWELRAAQPGKAWVSQKGRKTSMKPVVVGDRLEGFGRVTNIAYVNGKWVVTGTSGTIRQ